jgi:hypothetical protein
VTAFPSPATAASSQKPPFRGLWSWPATSRPASSFPARSVYSSPAVTRFAPVDGRILAFDPLRFTSPGLLGCFLGLHSPPGLLPPSGSKRSTDSAASRLTFRMRPISVRSPPPFLSLAFGCGSSFPFRYFFGGLLFLTAFWHRTDFTATCSRAWARLDPLSARGVVKQLSHRRSTAAIPPRPLTQRGGIAVSRLDGRGFSRRIVSSRSRAWTTRGSCLPFPDPFLGSRALGRSLPIRWRDTGSDVPQFEGLSPRVASRHWRRQ